MIRVTVEIDFLEEPSDLIDTAQMTLLREILSQVPERLMTEKEGILEDYDGAPCAVFRVETIANDSEDYA